MHFAAALFLLLNFFINTDAARINSACSADSDNCGYKYFRCLDGQCIQRSKYCNGNYDCRDQSDEIYCDTYNQCPGSGTSYPFSFCPSSRKCIPSKWFCDGIPDCYNSREEANCKSATTSQSINVDRARLNAIEWIRAQSLHDSSTEKWGTLVHKTAVALYLSDPEFVTNKESTIRKEMAYELSIQFLSRLALKKVENVSSSDIASFINAFLVTCLDPRKFYGINLVEELRSRVDKTNYTSPYLLLTLCNAGETITDTDMKKLVEAFWNKQREFWTETQALAVMAIVCAAGQSENGLDSEMIKEYTLELKQHQYRNGTVENLQTTALVLQALYSAESDEDPDNFDGSKALQQIISHQNIDGSFGNLMKTYYVLPVLSCKSLVNISSDHCEKVSRDESSALQYLVNQHGSKRKIKYSLWIGNERDLERTLTLRVPSNMSFYGIMEIAADIDARYKFEYTVKKRKPYINALSGILDDSESENFWFPYIIQGGKPVLLEKSPADIIPKEHDHLVMWYRHGSWIE